MRFNFNLLLVALVTLPAALGKVNGRCSSGNGVCVSTSSCKKYGGTYKSGLCPHDASNVKCCNKSKCVAPNGDIGSCKFTSSCKGKSYSGICPGGSNFKCCVEKSTKKSSSTKNKSTKKSKVSGSEIVKYAKKFLGRPYVWNGTSLTKGCDCSGFTQQVFKHFNIKIPRNSKEQSKKGSYVKNLSKAQAGDLVFYCEKGSVHHVAIYQGKNRIVHAANSRRGIVEDRANYQTPCKIRRFI